MVPRSVVIWKAASYMKRGVKTAHTMRWRRCKEAANTLTSICTQRHRERCEQKVEMEDYCSDG